MQEANQNEYEKANEYEMVYNTTDLYLSAYLLVKGHRFTYEKKGRRGHFSFVKTSPDLDVHANEYLMGIGSCEPLAYANAIKNLKNLLFNK
jgi:hypothetical protein